jgi:hypothetical protein
MNWWARAAALIAGGLVVILVPIPGHVWIAGTACLFAGLQMVFHGSPAQRNKGRQRQVTARVWVTPWDVLRGRPCNINECAVARAGTRAFGRPVATNGLEMRFEVPGSGVMQPYTRVPGKIDRRILELDTWRHGKALSVLRFWRPVTFRIKLESA